MRATPLSAALTWCAATLAGGGTEAAGPGAPAPGADEVLAGLRLTAVVTDSRAAGPGALFVAIAGERTDGHRFVGAVARDGAVAALVSDVDAARASLAQAGQSGDFPLLVVPDTVVALGEIARGYLASLRELARQEGRELSVLGVTGSVGKTTTKDLTRQVLAAQAPTVAPVASFNNEIGLPLTVLEADERTRYLVLEMGASGPGHIAYLTRIAPLDAAAVLMVGHAHMGGFGSIDAVARAKAEIIEGLVPSGTAVLNLDDPRVAAMRPLAPGPVIGFTRQALAAGDAGPTVWASNIRLDGQAHPVLDMGTPSASTTSLRLAVPGEHNVANALAAAGLACAVGVAPERVFEALAHAGLESPHRMAVSEVTWRGGDLLVIDDAYNANIDSVGAALRALPALAGGRRAVVVLSEMRELGESSDADHATAGRLVGEAGAQVLVTIGTLAQPAAHAAQAAGVRTICLGSADEAIDLLSGPHSPLRGGDAVLLKGSHGSGAWRVADHLLADATAPKEEFDS